MARSLPRDPWVLLGVPRTASDTDIKKAYRQLARQYHPDHHGGDHAKEARFQEIAPAFAAIKNQEARDKWLSENERGISSEFSPLGDDFYDTKYDTSAPAAATSSAGPGPSRQGASSGTKSYKHTITISFRESFLGANKEIKLEVDEPCGTCGGSGAAPGTSPRRCGRCQGRGEHVVGGHTQPCIECDATGYIIEKSCPRCIRGIIRVEKPFQLSIPPGVVDGQQIRIPGPRGGRIKAADIIVTVKIIPSKIFLRTMRDPADLKINLPITYTEACFGGQVKIQTPSQSLLMEVKPGTPPERLLRVQGQGMPKVGGAPGERGDLYASVKVVIPKDLSGPQTKLIQQLGHYDDADRLRTEMFTALRDDSGDANA